MKKFKLIKRYPGLPDIYKEGMAVKLYPENRNIYYPIDNRSGVHKNEVENNPEFWEKVKEKTFEILKVRRKKDGHIQEYLNIMCNNCINDMWEIYSVKRLSDGEVFTIGDLVTYDYKKDSKNWKIREFRNHISGKAAYSMKGDFCVITENNFRKVLPILTTEDGVDLCEGDEYYYINISYPDYPIYANYCSKGQIKKNHFKYFTSRTKAKEYKKNNIKKYSKNDINIAIKKSKVTTYNINVCKLKSNLNL